VIDRVYSVDLPAEGDTGIAYEGSKAPYARTASGKISKKGGAPRFQSRQVYMAARAARKRRAGAAAKRAATRAAKKAAAAPAKKGAKKGTAKKGAAKRAAGGRPAKKG
jgi:hypothetical protein